MLYAIAMNKIQQLIKPQCINKKLKIFRFIFMCIKLMTKEKKLLPSYTSRRMPCRTTSLS